MDEKDVFDKLFDQAPQKLDIVKQVNEFDRIITTFILHKDCGIVWICNIHVLLVSVIVTVN